MAVYDAVNDAVEPAGAFAAGGALAAGFFEIEVAQSFQGLNHAYVFVHHDDRARAEHGAGFGDGVVVHGEGHHHVAGNHGRRRAARDDGFQFFAAAHTACHGQKVGKGRAERHFVVARAFNVSGHGKEFGAACVGNAFIGKGLTAVADDKRDGGESFGVVDGGGLAEQTERSRERGFEARLAFFAFERFEQRGFFAADVCAVAVVGKEFEIEAAAQDVFAKEACFPGFGQSGFKALVAFENFAVNIVVTGTRTHGIAADDHAFNQGMRIETDDIAVFEGTGFAFVGVADDVFFAGEGTGHEAPFQAGREAGTAAPAQAGSFDFGNHVVLRRFFGQNFTQGGVAAAFDVFFQRPAIGIGGIHLVKNHA